MSETKEAKPKEKAKPKVRKNVATVDKDVARLKDQQELEKDVAAIVNKIMDEQREKQEEEAAMIQGFMKKKQGVKTGPPINPRPMEPKDDTYIPEFVDLPDGTRRRIKHPGYHYRWGRFKGPNPKVPTHRVKGWRLLRYEDTFKGTGWFEEAPGGYVLNGDSLLMEISEDGYKALVEEKRKLDAQRERFAEDAFFEAAQSLGVESFKDYGDRRENMT